MRTYHKNRPRLLIICKDSHVRNDLVVLLTGSGYFVDYVETRIEGLRKFRQHKHAVIFMDVPSLPRFPNRLFKLFRVYKRNPIVLILAQVSEEKKVYPYLSWDIYDIVSLPLNADYQHHTLKRLVEHSAKTSRLEFLQMLFFMAASTLPLWLLFLYYLSRRF
jgi:DNA-binding NtrC family response regulator